MTRKRDAETVGFGPQPNRPLFDLILGILDTLHTSSMGELRRAKERELRRRSASFAAFL